MTAARAVLAGWSRLTTYGRTKAWPMGRAAGACGDSTGAPQWSAVRSRKESGWSAQWRGSADARPHGCKNRAAQGASRTEQVGKSAAPAEPNRSRCGRIRCRREARGRAPPTPALSGSLDGVRSGGGEGRGGCAQQGRQGGGTARRGRRRASVGAAGRMLGVPGGGAYLCLRTGGQGRGEASRMRPAGRVGCVGLEGGSAGPWEGLPGSPPGTKRWALGRRPCSQVSNETAIHRARR